MVDKNSRWRPFCGVLNSKTIQYAYTCRAYYLTLVYLIMRSFKMYDWRMNNLFSDTVCTHCTVHNSAAMPGCVFFHLRFQPIVGDYISMQFGKRSKQTPTSIEAKSKSTVAHPARPTLTAASISSQSIRYKRFKSSRIWIHADFDLIKMSIKLRMLNSFWCDFSVSPPRVPPCG